MGIAESFVAWPVVPWMLFLSPICYCCWLSPIVPATKSTAITPLLVVALTTRIPPLLLLCVSCQINSLVCPTIVTVSVSLCLQPVLLQQHWAHISFLWCSVVIVVVSAVQRVDWWLLSLLFLLAEWFDSLYCTHLVSTPSITRNTPYLHKLVSIKQLRSVGLANTITLSVKGAGVLRTNWVSTLQFTLWVRKG
jgi:hypothetical protein